MGKSFKFLMLMIFVFFAACSAKQTEEKVEIQNNTDVAELNTVELSGNDSQIIEIPITKQSACSNLDSQLYEVTQADQPAKLAEAKGLRVINNKVQVLIVMAGEDTAFLSEYDVDLGTQSGNQVQALVPFNNLCELANLDAVQAIRIPSQLVNP